MHNITKIKEKVKNILPEAEKYLENYYTYQALFSEFQEKKAPESELKKVYKLYFDNYKNFINCFEPIFGISFDELKFNVSKLNEYFDKLLLVMSLINKERY